MTPATREPEFFDDERGFQRFVLLFAATFFGALAVLFAALVILDPYDTGRFATFMPPGVADESPRTGNASRGRDPSFDAAVFGNSRAMLLSPARLSQGTGFHFVQLTSPGSGPREAMVLLGYFLRHHTRVSGIVLSVDERWCTHDATLPVYFPFPFWLYGDDGDYLAGLFNVRAVTAARDRILLALGRKAEYDRTGYFDYEAGKTWNFRPAQTASTQPSPDAKPAALDLSFPALDRLEDALKQLPAGTPVVLLFSPVFHTLVPPAGTPRFTELQECKARFAQLANRRPYMSVLDFLSDTPLARDPRNFMDVEHFRGDVARMIEARIAEKFTAAYDTQQ